VIFVVNFVKTVKWLKLKFEYLYINREDKMKFCWATISVKDMAKSLQFYQELIGLPVVRTMKPNPGMEIAFLGTGDTQVELIYNSKAEAVSFGKDICLGFEVESLEKITGVLKSRNIPVDSGPFQPNPNIRFLYVLDPDGLKIQFVENIK
jgi:lactoylglutathione lyase